MNKLVILLLLTSTIWAQNITSAKRRKRRHWEEARYEERYAPKPNKRSFVTKIIGDLWDVVIAHAKRWYVIVAISLVLWYKLGYAFPFRDTIASYFR